jgi:hypothetical protein
MMNIKDSLSLLCIFCFQCRMMMMMMMMMMIMMMMMMMMKNEETCLLQLTLKPSDVHSSFDQVSET